MLTQDAVLVLNKPKNMSSFLAVKLVKKILGAGKAGHMGTLDPLADGVLVIGLNKATKLFEKFLNSDKEYISIFKFGVETNTLDLDGEIIRTDNKVVSEEELRKVLKTFIGKQQQLPPVYSAKKINGKRACDMAREGKEIVLQPKEIEIYNLELLEKLEENAFKVKISCSSGTYVRAIVRDVAERLSTCGMTLAITRTKCGVLCIENSYTLEDLRAGNYKLIDMKELTKE